MTHDEIMADLNDRINRGIAALYERRSYDARDDGATRYYGKIEGLKLVKDWLRSYPNGGT